VPTGNDDGTASRARTGNHIQITARGALRSSLACTQGSIATAANGARTDSERHSTSAPTGRGA
jgi:hypothetical protein